MNRAAKTWLDDIKDILTHSSDLSPKGPKLSIVRDTMISLTWINPAADYDSITIERRTSTTTFKRIASLPGDTTAFSEHKLPRNMEYYYRVIAHYPNNEALYSYPQKILLPTYIPKEPPVRKFFTGNPLAIPGRIEAETFDIGEEGMTYHDVDTKNSTRDYRPDEPVDIYDLGNGSYYVIDNYPGEWLEYTVNVAEKGLYDINAYIAAYPGGGTFKVKIGAVESEIIKSPNTSNWAITKPVGFSMNLEAGIQIMRLSFIAKPLFYIDYLEFTKNTPVGTSSVNNDNLSILQNDHELIVRLGTTKPAGVLKIYNILGTEVKTIRNPESDIRISTSDMRSGIYIVQVITGNQKISQKVIIQ
jgi:hypothetical protein